MSAEIIVPNLVREEGLELKPYHDSLGYLTIGFGRCLDKKPISKVEAEYLLKHFGISNVMDGITKEAAYYLLKNDISDADHDVMDRIPWAINLSDVRYSVLVMMVYQMGIGGVLGFKKFLAALQAGDIPTAQREMLNSKWAREDSPARALRMAHAILYDSFG
jgi:lysozyme